MYAAHREFFLFLLLHPKLLRTIGVDYDMIRYGMICSFSYFFGVEVRHKKNSQCLRTSMYATHREFFLFLLYLGLITNALIESGFASSKRVHVMSNFSPQELDTAISLDSIL